MVSSVITQDQPALGMRQGAVYGRYFLCIIDGQYVTNDHIFHQMWPQIGYDTWGLGHLRMMLHYIYLLSAR